MKILIVTPENERIQLSRISKAEVDAIIPGLPSQSKLLNWHIAIFFRAFKCEGFLLPEAHSSFMVNYYDELSLLPEKNTYDAFLDKMEV